VKLDGALRGVTHLGIDTAPIIYLIETHPRYVALVDEPRSIWTNVRDRLMPTHS
jgi:hypothetical protein